MKRKPITNKLCFALFLHLTLFVQGCNEIQVQNYFLPKGFTGNIAIIYTSNGTISTGQQDWQIPGDGMLKTPFRFVAGDYFISYYQLNSANRYDTLHELLPGKKMDSSKNWIVFPRILSFKRHDSDESYDVKTFYVGKKSPTELGKDRFLFERRLKRLLLER